MLERELQDNVIRLAGYMGWLCYHTYDSRRSQPGFPDLVLLRGKRCLVIELKVKNRKPTEAQKQWLEAFGLVPGIEAYLLSDADWMSGKIDLILAKPKPRPQLKDPCNICNEQERLPGLDYCGRLHCKEVMDYYVTKSRRIQHFKEMCENEK